jgi:hypothetical protein
LENSPTAGRGRGRGQPTSHRSKKRKKITRRRGKWERKTKVKRIIHITHSKNGDKNN